MPVVFLVLQDFIAGLCLRQKKVSLYTENVENLCTKEIEYCIDTRYSIHVILNCILKGKLCIEELSVSKRHKNKKGNNSNVST